MKVKNSSSDISSPDSLLSKQGSIIVCTKGFLKNALCGIIGRYFVGCLVYLNANQMEGS